MFGLFKKKPSSRSYSLAEFGEYVRQELRGYADSPEKTAVVVLRHGSAEIIALVNIDGGLAFVHAPDTRPLNLNMFSSVDEDVRNVAADTGASPAEKELRLRDNRFMRSHAVQVAADFWRSAYADSSEISVERISDIPFIPSSDDLVADIQSELTIAAGNDYLILGADVLESPAIQVKEGYEPETPAEAFIFSFGADAPVTFAELRDNLNGFAWRKDIVSAMRNLASANAVSIVEGDEYIPDGDEVFGSFGEYDEEGDIEPSESEQVYSSEIPVSGSDIVTGGADVRIADVGGYDLLSAWGEAEGYAVEEDVLCDKVRDIEAKIVPLAEQYFSNSNSYREDVNNRELSLIALGDKEDKLPGAESADSIQGASERRSSADVAFFELQKLEEERDEVNERRQINLENLLAEIRAYGEPDSVPEIFASVDERLLGIDSVERITLRKVTQEDLDSEDEALRVWNRVLGDGEDETTEKNSDEDAEDDSHERSEALADVKSAALALIEKQTEEEDGGFAFEEVDDEEDDERRVEVSVVEVPSGHDITQPSQGHEIAPEIDEQGDNAPVTDEGDVVPAVGEQEIPHGVPELRDISEGDVVWSTPIFEQVVQETGFRPRGL